ncbi:MAG: hypothetical protein AB1331_05745 [Bacillota bacterium]
MNWNASKYAFYGAKQAYICNPPVVTRAIATRAGGRLYTDRQRPPRRLAAAVTDLRAWALF